MEPAVQFDDEPESFVGDIGELVIDTALPPTRRQSVPTLDVTQVPEFEQRMRSGRHVLQDRAQVPPIAKSHPLVERDRELGRADPTALAGLGDDGSSIID